MIVKLKEMDDKMDVLESIKDLGTEKHQLTTNTTVLETPFYLIIDNESEVLDKLKDNHDKIYDSLDWVILILCIIIFIMILHIPTSRYKYVY